MECLSCKTTNEYHFYKVKSQTLCKSCMKWWVVTKRIVKKKATLKQIDSLNFNVKKFKFWDWCLTNFNRSKKECEICGRIDKLCIDHCHSSWKFRWILCTKCNLWLWLFNDNTGSLLNAIKYLNNKKEHLN